MNLSETAFATRLDGDCRFHLRWFTPNSEVDLCGHATLATAHVLWEEGTSSPRSGSPLRDPERAVDRAARTARDRAGLPLRAVESEVTSADELARSSKRRSRPPSASPAAIGSICWSSCDDEDDAQQPSPRHPQAGQLPVRGVIVTSRSASIRVRLRLPLLRAPGRRRRGSRLRLGPLLPRSVLGGEAGEIRADRPPGLAAAGASSGSAWKGRASSSSATP